MAKKAKRQPYKKPQQATPQKPVSTDSVVTSEAVSPTAETHLPVVTIDDVKNSATESEFAAKKETLINQLDEEISMYQGMVDDEKAKAEQAAADLNQTALLEEILKEAVINRRDERIELEQRKHDEERRDEHIAPFGIADGADFLFCSLHPESPILPTFVCPNDDLWHPAGVWISLPEVTIGTEYNFLRKASRDGRNARPCRLVCDANYSASGHWKFTSSGYFSEMMLSNCALASSMVALPSK